MKRSLAIVVVLMILLLRTAPTGAQGKKSVLDDKRIATLAEIEEHLRRADPAVGGDRAKHIHWFGTVYPPDDETKAKVARKLIEFTEDRSAVVRGRAGFALPNWATEEIGPKLIDLINGTGPTEKEGALIAVGRIKYKPAIPVLVRLLEHGNGQGLAVKALIDIGPDCEDKVTPLLELRSNHALRGSLRVLEKVATSKSLPALEKAAKTIREPEYAGRARAIAQAIKEREAAGK